MPHYRVHAAATVEAADDADVTAKLDRLACLVCDTEFADWSLEAELVEDADHCPACGPHADDGHLPDCPTADEHDNPLHGFAYANLNGPIERDDELAVYATDEHAAHALDALGFAWRIIVDHPPTEPPPSCEICVRRTEREARALVHELETNGSTAIAIANNRLVPDAEEDDD